MGLNHRDHWLISAVFQDLLPLLGVVALWVWTSYTFVVALVKALLVSVCLPFPGPWKPSWGACLRYTSRFLQVLPRIPLFTLESVASAIEAATFCNATCADK